MTPSRVRKRVGIALTIAGALAGVWMAFRAYRFILVDGMASTFGDQNGWPGLLVVVAVLLSCLALVAVGYRAAGRPPPPKYATGELLAATSTTLGLVLLSLGGWGAIAGLLPLGIASVMLVTSFGDPEARYPKPRSPAP